MNTKHVTSLELSKELYEQGIVTDAEWWWLNNEIDREIKLLESCYKDLQAFDKICPALLLTELLELLPYRINDDLGATFLSVKLCDDLYNEKRYVVEYPTLISTHAPNPCNACAEMLLHLKKEGLI